MTRPLRGLAATLWERQLQNLQSQLDPTVGAQLAHTDDFGTSGNDDRNNGDVFFGHEESGLCLSLAVLDKKATARKGFYRYISVSHC
jgi:hypothetical protein